jgi:hypothetical protein
LRLGYGGCAMRSPVPSVDDEARRRLKERFGAEADEWFDELPDVLSSLTERWQVEFGSPIPRGSMSVVIRAGGVVEVRRC